MPPAAATAPPRPVLLRLDLLGLAALLALVILLACYAPSPLLSAAATITWLALVARGARLRPAAMLMLTPFLLIHLSVMVSLVAIESGAFMKEIGSTGGPSLAGVLYPVVSLLFVGMAVLAHGFWTRRAARHAPSALTVEHPQPWWLAHAAILLGLGVDLYLTARGLAGGFPLLSGTDRFQYRAGADVLTLNLLNLKVVIAAALGTGALAAAGTRRQWLHHGLFVMYLLLSFLFGDKFFNILVAALVYAMPVISVAPERITRRLYPWLPLAIVLAVTVFGVTLYTYSNQGALSPAETLERFADRIAGQGQLWWVAVRDNGQWLHFDTAAVQANLGSLTATPAATYVFEQRLLAFYFVERYAPPAMHLSFLHNNGLVTPTMLFEAYALVVMGGVGLIAATAVAGLFTGSVLWWLQRRMLEGQVVNVLLPAFLLIQTFYLMAQAALYSVISPSAAKAYLAFLALQGLVWGWLRLTAPRRMEVRHV